MWTVPGPSVLDKVVHPNSLCGGPRVFQLRSLEILARLLVIFTVESTAHTVSSVNRSLAELNINNPVRDQGEDKLQLSELLDRSKKRRLATTRGFGNSGTQSQLQFDDLPTPSTSPSKFNPIVGSTPLLRNFPVGSKPPPRRLRPPLPPHPSPSLAPPPLPPRRSSLPLPIPVGASQVPGAVSCECYLSKGNACSKSQF